MERARRRRENPKENPKVSKEPKVRTRVKSRLQDSSGLGSWGLEHSKSGTLSETQESAQTCPTVNSHTDNSWCDDGWSYAGWNDGWSSVVWHEVWDQAYDNSSSSLSLGSFDLGEQSVAVWMGENEPGHRSYSDFISIELWSRRSRRWKVLSGSQWWTYSWLWTLSISRLRWKRFAPISERKTCGWTQSVVQYCRDRVQRTTRFPLGTRQWFRDSCEEQNWSGCDDTWS